MHGISVGSRTLTLNPGLLVDMITNGSYSLPGALRLSHPTLWQYPHDATARSAFHSPTLTAREEPTMYSVQAIIELGKCGCQEDPKIKELHNLVQNHRVMKMAVRLEPMSLDSQSSVLFAFQDSLQEWKPKLPGHCAMYWAVSQMIKSS